MGEKVAIKKISNVFDNRVDALRTLREMMFLRYLRHDNVIGLKDVMVPPYKRSFKDVYLVYELMDTDLHKIINSPQQLSNDHCRFFLIQIRPCLFVNADCDLKTGDLGLARTKSTKAGQFMTEYVVTRCYRAPELLVCSDEYGTFIDVWSVGCILAELLGRKPIFSSSDCLNQLKLIVDVLGPISDADMGFIDNPKARQHIKSLPQQPGMRLCSLYPNADPCAVDLLQKMLAFDPSKRIIVDEALAHPYMSPLYDPAMNPPAKVPIDLEIDDELGVDIIWEKMWHEMMHNHPEELVILYL